MRFNSKKAKNGMTLLLSISLGLVVLFSSFTSYAFYNSETAETLAWSGTQTSSAGTYYEEARGLKGNALKTSLDTIISRNVSTSYDWARYESADEAEGDNSKVLQIYTRTTIAKTAHVNGSLGWNREHTYPDSKISSPANADNLHIFASDNKVNSIRGNKLFGIVTPKDTSTDVQDSLGNTIDAYTNSTVFEPGNAAKGEVARATLYLNTAYGYTITGNFTSEALCLDWAKNYPVTNREIYRNNTVYTLQGNRNPYIDHPEFIDMVYDPTYSGSGALNDTGAEVTPTSLSLSPSSASIGIGNTQNLTVSALPSGASTSVTWSSSNNSIATVANGVVTAKAEGQATITATSASNSSIKATMTVTVTPPLPPTSISVNPATVSIAVGNTSPLTVTSSPAGTSNSVTWATSNANVAIVNSNGIVSGLAVGSATITATSTVNTQLTSTCQVSVTEASANTLVNNYQDITAGNYIITVDNAGSKYYLPTQPTGFANGSSTITSFSNVASINETNAWTFTSNGTNSWKIAKGSYYLNSTTDNDGIGATEAGSADFWVASQGTTGIYLKSNAGGRFLTAALTLSPIEWRGYQTANTNGTSNLLLYRLGSGSSVSPTTEANTWASDFLSQTSLGCQNKNLSQLQSVWSSVSSNYAALSEAAKMLISSTTPNAFGSDLENAMARYIDIVAKYDLQAFINGVVVPSQNLPSPIIPEDNMAFLLIFLNIFVIAGVLIFVMIRKAKHL